MAVFFGSIFLDFRPPNATTWFYLSLVLAIGLFFKFNRLFHLRNWDILLLFLLVPAMLFLREGQEKRTAAQAALPVRMAQVAATASGCAGQFLAGPAGAGLPTAAAPGQVEAVQTLTDDSYGRARHEIWLAYLWLLIGSAYFLGRCLIDLNITRRPVLIPNLNAPGLAWLGLTLLVVLSVRTLFPANEPVPEASNKSVILEKAADAAAQAAETVNQTVAPLPLHSVTHWVRSGLAIAGHVAVVLALFWIGTVHFQNATAGVAAGVLYLMLPYTAYHVKDIHHVLPAALLVTAVATYRRPILAGLLLGLASVAAYFPLVLFPLWFGFYRQRGSGRFTVAFLFVPACFGAYLLLEPSMYPEIQGALLLPDWRAWDVSARPTAEGLWTGLELHYAYRVPLFIGYLALVVTSMFWPSPKNLAHLIALSGALIVGVQFWYADAGGIHVLWYLPFLILIYIRPNLSERFPPAIDPSRDRVRRLGRWAWRRLRRQARRPEPATPAVAVGEPR